MLLIPTAVGGSSERILCTAVVFLVCVGTFFLAGETAYERLSYDPRSLNPIPMVASAFLHEGFPHLLGNMFFFLCFSAAVEERVHVPGYILLFVFIALVECVAYHFTSQNVPDALPSVGISGVVWGFMGLILFVNPATYVTCFLWFLWIIRSIEVPVIVFVVGFLIFELFDLRSGVNDGTNHVAHVAGFGAGVLARVMFWPYLKRAETTRPPREAARPGRRW